VEAPAVPWSLADRLAGPLTLADCALLMLAVSDNAATNVLLGRLGFEAVNEEARRLGAERTQIARFMVSDGPENLTCARDLTRGLAAIDEERVLEALDCARDSLLPYLLPARDVRVKTGELATVYNEVALVDNSLAVAVFHSPGPALGGRRCGGPDRRRFPRLRGAVPLKGEAGHADTWAVDAAQRNEILNRYREHSRRFDSVATRRNGGAEVIPFAAPLQELEQEPTAREIEVLQLISDGLVNREIGVRLFLSEETVKSHVRHLLAKLQARSRAHAVAVGFRRGLIA
jgi:DNA-binding CsgD family transcriptional regulator